MLPCNAVLGTGFGDLALVTSSQVAERCIGPWSVPSCAVSFAHALLRAPQMWKQYVGWWNWVQSWQP